MSRVRSPSPAPLLQFRAQLDTITGGRRTPSRAITLADELWCSRGSLPDHEWRDVARIGDASREQGADVGAARRGPVRLLGVHELAPSRDSRWPSRPRTIPLVLIWSTRSPDHRQPGLDVVIASKTADPEDGPACAEGDRQGDLDHFLRLQGAAVLNLSEHPWRGYQERSGRQQDQPPREPRAPRSDQADAEYHRAREEQEQRNEPEDVEKGDDTRHGRGNQRRT